MTELVWVISQEYPKPGDTGERWAARAELEDFAEYERLNQIIVDAGLGCSQGSRTEEDGVTYIWILGSPILPSKARVQQWVAFVDGVTS